MQNKHLFSEKIVNFAIKIVILTPTMKHYRSYVALLVAWLIAGMCAAQPQPVKVTSQLKTLSETKAELVFDAVIDNGWHIYSTQLVPDGPTPATFNVEALQGCQLDGTLQPVGQPVKQYEEMFGAEVYFFEKKARFVQRFKLDGGPFSIQGYFQYGACNDQMCTPPTNVEVEIKNLPTEQQTLPPAPPCEGGEYNDTADTLPATPLVNSKKAENSIDLWQPVVEELRSLESSSNGESSFSPSPLGEGAWGVKLIFLGFLGGLLALLTPCVWPIIPMTVSFFLKRSGNKQKGIRDAWLYGLSIVVIYVTLGLLVTAIFGANALNSLATNAVFNIFFFLLLVVFAASFFGAFELSLPASWSNAVDAKAEKTGGLLGIFLMAFTLTLVSFSCTGPIIGFLLVEVATDGGSWLAPTLGMLGFAIALALPFTLFAMFPSWLKQLPKSGGWMNTVKVVLGFIELAFALKFLSVADLAYGWHILDRETFLALWIVLFGLLGLYLLGKIRFPHDNDDSGKVGVVRFFLAMISLAFAVYMLPGLWGAPLKAISAFAPPMKTQDFNLMPEAEVRPMFTDYEAGMQYAREHKKPVMLDFTGYGCVNCRKMEAAVWTDERVAQLMTQDYVLIQLYVDDKTSLPEPYVVESQGEERKLRTVGDKWSWLQSHKFGANAQPFYVLLTPDGHPLTASRAYDEDVEAYIRFLEEGLKKF